MLMWKCFHRDCSILIFMALRNSKTGSLPVSEIYSFMTEHFPYFKVSQLRFLYHLLNLIHWKNKTKNNNLRIISGTSRKKLKYFAPSKTVILVHIVKYLQYYNQFTKVDFWFFFCCSFTSSKRLEVNFSWSEQWQHVSADVRIFFCSCFR